MNLRTMLPYLYRKNTAILVATPRIKNNFRRNYLYALRSILFNVGMMAR